MQFEYCCFHPTLFSQADSLIMQHSHLSALKCVPSNPPKWATIVARFLHFRGRSKLVVKNTSPKVVTKGVIKLNNQGFH